METKTFALSTPLRDSVHVFNEKVLSVDPKFRGLGNELTISFGGHRQLRHYYDDEEFFSFDFETNILDTVYRLAHKETSAWMSSSRTRDAGKQPWPLRMITPGVYLVNTPKEIASILYWRGMTDGGMCHIPDVYLESNGERAMAIRGNGLDFYESREFLSMMVTKLRSYAPEAYTESSFSKE